MVPQRLQICFYLVEKFGKSSTLSSSLLTIFSCNCKSNGKRDVDWTRSIRKGVHLARALIVMSAGPGNFCIDAQSDWSIDSALDFTSGIGKQPESGIVMLQLAGA